MSDDQDDNRDGGGGDADDDGDGGGSGICWVICWYCHWGWPKQVREIYNRIEKELDDFMDMAIQDWHVANKGPLPESMHEPTGAESALKYGPAHVVWCDENFGSDTVGSCLADCDDPCFRDWMPGAMDFVRRSLAELLAIPESIRCCVPDDYDGEHPELFPPPAGIEVVK